MVIFFDEGDNRTVSYVPGSYNYFNFYNEMVKANPLLKRVISKPLGPRASIKIQDASSDKYFVWPSDSYELKKVSIAPTGEEESPILLLLKLHNELRESKQVSIPIMPLEKSLRYQYHQLLALNRWGVPSPYVFNYSEHNEEVRNEHIQELKKKRIRVYSLLQELINSPSEDIDLMAINQMESRLMEQLKNNGNGEREKEIQDSIGQLQEMRKAMIQSQLYSSNLCQILGTTLLRFPRTEEDEDLKKRTFNPKDHYRYHLMRTIKYIDNIFRYRIVRTDISRLEEIASDK